MTASTGTWRIASADAAQAPVAVIGAGVMGAGIAQVAAQAGHPVRLMDLREGAAAAAIAQIGKALDSLVAKGRMAQDARAACHRSVVALQYQCAGAFGHHEAVAVLRERL